MNNAIRKSMGDIAALVEERGKTHGDWLTQSACTHGLKEFIRLWAVDGPGLSPGQQEALDMIATKIGRIIIGNPHEPDHWDDIAGYAQLGKKG